MTDLPDLSEAHNALQAPATELRHAITASEDLAITDVASRNIAAELLAQMAGALKTIETRRKELSLPLTRVARQINEAAKASAGPLTRAEFALRLKLRDYESEQAALRETQREAQQIATGQTVVDPSTLAPEPDKTVHTASGQVTMRKRWTYDLLDLEALASAAAADWDAFGRFLMPCTSEIAAYVRHGGRELPGVDIRQMADPVVRS